MKAKFKKSCSKCKYADWDADGCTCMIEKRLIGNAFAYVCDNFSSAKPFTNGDRIRQMDDEELADIIGFNECKNIAHNYECPAYSTRNIICNGSCREYFLKWLKQEAAE